MELFVKMCSLHLICLVQAPHLSPNPDCPVLHTTLHVYKCTDFKSPVVCFVFYSHSETLQGSTASYPCQFMHLWGTTFISFGIPELHLAVILWISPHHRPVRACPG